MARVSFGALHEKKKTWWQFASRCCWNRGRPWHASELVSFLVRLRTYQHPGITAFLRSDKWNFNDILTLSYGIFFIVISVGRKWDGRKRWWGRAVSACLAILVTATTRDTSPSSSHFIIRRPSTPQTVHLSSSRKRCWIPAQLRYQNRAPVYGEKRHTFGHAVGWTWGPFTVRGALDDSLSCVCSRVSCTPQSLPKPILHTVPSSASSFNFQYLFVSLLPSSSCLPLPPCLPVPSTFPSIRSFRSQSLHKMWPIQLDVLPLTVP